MSKRVVPSGAVRNVRSGKGRFDLLPVRAMQLLAEHFEGGAEAHGDRNWEKGQPLSWFVDSALRHSFQALKGDCDEQHAVAAAWNWLAFVETVERIRNGSLPAELDDLGVLCSRWPKKEEVFDALHRVSREALRDPGKFYGPPQKSESEIRKQAEKQAREIGRRATEAAHSKELNSTLTRWVREVFRPPS